MMKPNKEKNELAAAEATLIYHSIKHGLSYLAQECSTNVCKTIFSTSNTAKNLSCARTKATAISINALAPFFTNKILNEIQFSQYFSMSFDASNKGNMKMYPFCVQYLSEIGVKKGSVDFIDDASGSATNVHRNAREVLEKHHLNVQNLTTIGVYNTNVNVGEQQSVYKLFRDEFSDLIKDSSFFGSNGRSKLASLSEEKAVELKNSFVKFIQRTIEYIDEYYSQKKRNRQGEFIIVKGSVPSHLFEAISPFGSPEIDRLTWQQVIECTERLKLKTLNEDQLFDEFNGIQLTFKAIKDKKIPLYDQIKLSSVKKLVHRTPK
ncbi:unnamed protein product [Didymodactylos carnosus]|uniref:DUF4371 domain-containing protein n=2 Tax=Didymodactylos carnosus TaxID=1234261 RepID=A0A814M2V1_9BILA|nr:unnamed protein product [Didymodactylos carnosus]CAF3839972.1 unnamed protein product [Didymodactylos carnosus]